MMNTNKVVLVTGTTSGFGRLIAETLAREGYDVYASMRHSKGKNLAVAQEFVSLAEQEALKLSVIDLDVTDDRSVTQAIEHIVKTAGRLDVVVNNAGVGSQGPLEAYTDEQIYQLFNTNVFGVLRVNRAALPVMRTQGEGLLIQVGSVLGRAAMPFFGLYSATKFALEGLTEAFNYELRLLSSGVESIVIEPGAYPTEFGQKTIMASDQTRIQPYARLLAHMGSMQALAMGGNGIPDPQEVADRVAQLIAMPAGSRPLRTVIAVPGQGEGAVAVNQASVQVVQAISGRLGLTAVPAKSS
ncbi:MAG TPA: SDR family oxidoreductase [Phototrophicaceae bacterium]|jgi:NAD(P)-dependent dehydrogenase (short-subunit alcohol dehydrogenase family)|nr:SDR family oxidoreductase [Phototrophicaceae bacterium]